MSVPIYEPINQLKRVAKNIWIVDGGQIEMDVKLFKMPFSTRMTIIRLSDGSLWCHSPIKPTVDLLKDVSQLGKVTHLVSPNMLHYAYISEWKKYYPNAISWASPGVEQRAASQNISVTFDAALENEAPATWDKEIDQLIFGGSRILDEVVFFHKASRTLILTDLIENFEPTRTESGLLRLIHRLGRVADPDGRTPVDLRMTFLGREKIARASYEKMLAWQPDKIILAHGRWYPENGVAELKRAFRWLNG